MRAGQDIVTDFEAGHDHLVLARYDFNIFGFEETRYRDPHDLDSDGNRRIEAGDMGVNLSQVDVDGISRSALRLDLREAGIIAGDEDYLQPGQSVLWVIGVTSLAFEDFLMSGTPEPPDA